MPNTPRLSTRRLKIGTTRSRSIHAVHFCVAGRRRRLVRGGGSRIVTFSSSLVGSLQPGYSAYVASKAAVEAMTKILEKELKGTSITANCVAPGPVATELFFSGKDEAAVKRIGGGQSDGFANWA